MLSGHILFLKEMHCIQFSETDTIQMLLLSIDNIFGMFGGRDFQKAVGIPMITNCASVLANLWKQKPNQQILVLFFNITIR